MDLDGLIIKKKWLNMILSRKKILEIRGSKTSKIGSDIYLLESGSSLIKGKCRIKGVIPITKEFWESNIDKHCVSITYEELLKIYKKPYAWELTDVKEFSEQHHYNHPKGAVIWVKNINISKKGE